MRVHLVPPTASGDKGSLTLLGGSISSKRSPGAKWGLYEEEYRGKSDFGHQRVKVELKYGSHQNTTSTKKTSDGSHSHLFGNRKDIWAVRSLFLSRCEEGYVPEGVYRLQRMRPGGNEAEVVA